MRLLVLGLLVVQGVAVNQNGILSPPDYKCETRAAPGRSTPGQDPQAAGGRSGAQGSAAPGGWFRAKGFRVSTSPEEHEKKADGEERHMHTAFASVGLGVEGAMVFRLYCLVISLSRLSVW